MTSKIKSEISVQDLINIPESIKVLVRVRPSSGDETSLDEYAVDIDDEKNSLTVCSTDGKRSFSCSFDSVLGPGSSQSDVYDVVKYCTESVLKGCNSTIFAYGQTGSGKTFTMYGPPGAGGDRFASLNSPAVGIVPRAVGDIFQVMSSKDVLQYSICCSFVQIYNENLYDMLRDGMMSFPLAIREDNKEIYVQGLSEYNVKSTSEILQLLRMAEQNRAVRETDMNQFSSRSHSIFQIIVYQKLLSPDGGEVSLKAKFNLVDLAGSEKWNLKVTNIADEHVSEMTNINLSLHTLGRCISALALASKRLSTASSKGVRGKDTHVPFRDAKLTRLLQDSLGGNSRTLLIATLSPARSNAEESVSTLKFADRARQVMVSVELNESRPIDHDLVKRLQREIAQLKGLLRQMMESGQTSMPAAAMDEFIRQDKGADLAGSAASAGLSRSMRASGGGDFQMTLSNVTSAYQGGGGSGNSPTSKHPYGTPDRHQQQQSMHMSSIKETGISVAAAARVSDRDADMQAWEQEALRLRQRQKSLEEHNQKLFQVLLQLQDISEKFFRFELEEEDLKRHMNDVFVNVQTLRPMPVSPVSKASHSQEQPQQQHRANRASCDSSSVNGSLTDRAADRPSASSSVVKMPQIRSAPAAPALLAQVASNGSMQRSIVAKNHSPIHNPPVPVPATTFRVRGKGGPMDVDSGWTSSQIVQQDEELVLQEELKKTKRKLKKEKELHDWLRIKEAKEQEAAMRQEEEIRARVQEAKEQEKQRQKRLKQQKKALNNYYLKMRSETEQLAELNELGIDPLELMELEGGHGGPYT